MCKGYIGPIRMVWGAGGKERALRGNGRWGKMERERRRARTSMENAER